MPILKDYLYQTCSYADIEQGVKYETQRWLGVFNDQRQLSSLVGVYFTKDELEIIAPILDSQSQNVTYYDPVKQQNITIKTYTGDWSIVNKSIVGHNGVKNEGFSISFISMKKRG